MQQQLLYPVLKHSSFPDEKRNQSPKLSTDLPEPKVLFSDLGKVAQLEYPEADISSEIVLNITLGDSYTYVYPKVEVTETIVSTYAFMGFYRTQGNNLTTYICIIIIVHLSLINYSYEVGYVYKFQNLVTQSLFHTFVLLDIDYS